eukprot:Rhum_TRINITY_DN2949_c0_g1::Rhum_TRINITY_DN2949_c0_g1_i1::g.9026::m.9026/K08857/NEK1_4_5; NIMA (never in mitosis gene a)-related kinase 1/4/5
MTTSLSPEEVEWGEAGLYYKKRGVLGQGSSGTVYHVESIVDGKAWVLKCVSWVGATDEVKESARAEASILKNCTHPNIVSVKETYEDATRFVMVMEYCEGGDLEDLISPPDAASDVLRKPLPLRDSLLFFAQACLAVSYLHKRNIIHRDLKTANVFLTQRGVVKIGDFGIAKTLGDERATTATMCGTPFCFSPELCEGKQYDKKTDIWALGIILYELLSGGTKPFQGTNLMALVNAILHTPIEDLKPPAPPDSIDEITSGLIWELIVDMLQKDPARRPSIQDVLSHPIVKKRLKDFAEEMKQIIQKRAPQQRNADGSVAATVAAPPQRDESPPPFAAVMQKGSPSDLHHQLQECSRQFRREAQENRDRLRQAVLDERNAVGDAPAADPSPAAADAETPVEAAQDVATRLWEAGNHSISDELPVGAAKEETIEEELKEQEAKPTTDVDDDVSASPLISPPSNSHDESRSQPSRGVDDPGLTDEADSPTSDAAPSSDSPQSRPKKPRKEGASAPPVMVYDFTKPAIQQPSPKSVVPASASPFALHSSPSRASVVPASGFDSSAAHDVATPTPTAEGDNTEQKAGDAGGYAVPAAVGIGDSPAPCQQCSGTNNTTLAAYHCVDCNHALCSACSTKLHSLRTFQHHRVVPILLSPLQPQPPKPLANNFIADDANSSPGRAVHGIRCCTLM